MPEASPTNPVRILLVEDDDAQRRGYRRVLGTAGFTVTEAEDGTVAAGLIERETFDVILSDISLPGMSGVKLLRVVRERDLDVPVILMTGNPTVETAVEAIEFGALRYLRKPVEPELLTKTLHEAARLHRLAKLKRQALALGGEDERQLGDKASLESRLESALASLWVAFQPIVSLSARQVFAHEGLMRSLEPTLPHPGAV